MKYRIKFNKRICIGIQIRNQIETRWRLRYTWFIKDLTKHFLIMNVNWISQWRDIKWRPMQCLWLLFNILRCHLFKFRFVIIPFLKQAKGSICILFIFFPVAWHHFLYKNLLFIKSFYIIFKTYWFLMSIVCEHRNF